MKKSLTMLNVATVFLWNISLVNFHLDKLDSPLHKDAFVQIFVY